MKLDLKNNKILTELEMNARIPHSELGKKVRCSKQVIKYRIEELESEDTIQGYNAIIDLSKLGDTIYVIYLKLIKMSTQKEKTWMEEVQKHPNVLAVGKNAGYWDLTVVIRCKNNHELGTIQDKIMFGKSTNIKDKLITSEIESTYLNMDLFSKSQGKAFSTNDKIERIEIDKIDHVILNKLSDNCRITLLDLSEKVKLSPNAVKGRIKNLEKKKIIIGYKTKINYNKFGYLHFRVFLHLNKFDNERYMEITSFLKNKGNIESVSKYIGYANMDFRCYSKSIEDFYKLMSEIKDKFLDNVIEIDSMPIFAWKKISYYSLVDK